jgi:hypothetical protein
LIISLESGEDFGFDRAVITKLIDIKAFDILEIEGSHLPPAPRAPEPEEIS